MSKGKKTIPEFASEQEEREFWLEHDSTEYLDWSQAERVSFPNLKLSTKSISLRLTESMINSLKVMANKNDVPYQSLIKMILAQAVDRHQGKDTRK